MIIPSSKDFITYEFVYNGIRGLFWEDEKIIAITFLHNSTPDTDILNKVMDELENYSNDKNKKMYFTNFCSKSFLDIMEERKYNIENIIYETEERKWQVNIKFYMPKESNNKSEKCSLELIKK